MKLRGTETLTCEVGASMDAAAARAAVPERFELEEVETGRARANLLMFKMSGLALRSMPFPAFDYSEALWRISIRHEGALAWFAVKCDIDHPIVRALGSRVVKYPTREAKIIASEARWKVETPAASLELRASSEEAAEMPVLRRTFVASGKRVYEIPWDEEPPPRGRSARIAVSDAALVTSTLGEGARLDDVGIVHRGRIHMCASARRL